MYVIGHWANCSAECVLSYNQNICVASFLGVHSKATEALIYKRCPSGPAKSQFCGCVCAKY